MASQKPNNRSGVRNEKTGDSRSPGRNTSPERTWTWSEKKLLAVARKFWEEGKNKTDIGIDLGISRQTVDAMLAEARSKGLVYIRVAPSAEKTQLLDIGRRLEDKFGPLREALVVPTQLHGGSTEGQVNVEETVLRLSFEAGRYLSDKLTNRDVAVIGAGQIVRASIRCIRVDQPLAGLRIAPLTGFLGRSLSSLGANAMALQAAVGGKYFWLPCPAIVRDDKHQNAELQHSLYEVVSQLPLVKRTLKLINEESTIVFTTIGEPTRKKFMRLVNTLFDDKNERKGFTNSYGEVWKSNPPVGEISGQLFDAAGQSIPAPWRTVGFQLSDIQDKVKDKQLKVVVVVGADPKRERAVKAALDGGLITTLITDYKTAEAILNMD